MILHAAHFEKPKTKTPRRDAILKIRFCANKECFGWVPKGSRFCVACNYERHRTKRDRKRVKLGTRRKAVANVAR